MGELDEQRWAVISERGCEASGITYAEAAALMQKLASEKVYGLSVVTQTAARHLPDVKAAISTLPEPAESRPARK
jgi:DNA-directed RNA polymerase subunit F